MIESNSLRADLNCPNNTPLYTHPHSIVIFHQFVDKFLLLSKLCVLEMAPVYIGMALNVRTSCRSNKGKTFSPPPPLQSRILSVNINIHIGLCKQQSVRNSLKLALRWLKEKMFHVIALILASFFFSWRQSIVQHL